MAWARTWSSLLALWVVSACGLEPEPTAECDTDADCIGRVCRMQLPETLTPLTQASLSCGDREPDLANPGQACGQSADCQHGLCTLAGGCLSACLLDSDCEINERCGEAFVRARGEALRAFGCLPISRASAPVELSTKVQTDAVTEDGGTLDLPGSTGPALYVVEHLDDTRFPFSSTCRPPLCATHLRTGDDAATSLFDEGSDAAPNSTPISDSPFSFPLTVYVGNSVSPTYSASGYELDVTAEVAGDVRLSQLTFPKQPDDGETLGLPLNLFFVGTTAQPTTDSLPAPITTALEKLKSIYAPAGITLGTITHQVVPDSLLTAGNTFSEPDEPRAGFAPLRRGYGVWPELPALLSLSAGAPNTGINLFFVSDIEGLGAGEPYAIAGGTPGPLTMQGTGASGIAIATDMLLNSPEVLGRTLAHELAHYLGLFHTTEADGSRLDPLTDTPRCPLVNDSNGDGTLSVGECAGLGDNNLMFWANTSGIELSAEQRTILRRSVRALAL